MKRELKTEEIQVINQAIVNKILPTYPEFIHSTVYSCASNTRPHKLCKEVYIEEAINNIIERSKNMAEVASKIHESAKKLKS